MSKLIEAAKGGDVDELSLLLCGLQKQKKLPGKLGQRDGNGLTALHHTAVNGFGPSSVQLLEAGASAVAADSQGQTPLHMAAWAGAAEIVTHLLDHGAPINLASRLGETALFVAAKNGHADTVSVLVERGADMTLRNHNWESPLAAAAAFGRVKVVEVMFRLQASQSSSIMQKQFLGAGALDAQSPVHLAVGLRDPELLKILLQHKPDLSVETQSGTALRHAAALRKENCVLMLLAADCPTRLSDAQDTEVQRLAEGCDELGALNGLLDLLVSAPVPKRDPSAALRNPTATGSIKTTSGEIVVKEGRMSKRAQRKSKTTLSPNTRDRWFVLTNASLSYFDGTPGKLGKPKGTIAIRDIIAVELPDGPDVQDLFIFQVIHTESVLTCQPWSECERNEWVRAVVGQSPWLALPTQLQRSQADLDADLPAIPKYRATANKAQTKKRSSLLTDSVKKRLTQLVNDSQPEAIDIPIAAASGDAEAPQQADGEDADATAPGPEDEQDDDDKAASAAAEGGLAVEDKEQGAADEGEAAAGDPTEKAGAEGAQAPPTSEGREPDDAATATAATTPPATAEPLYGNVTPAGNLLGVEAKSRPDAAVISWLGKLRLSQYEPHLARHGFTSLPDLADLQPDALSGLGISLLGHRRKLQVGLAKLQAGGTAAAAAAVVVDAEVAAWLRELGLHQYASNLAAHGITTLAGLGGLNAAALPGVGVELDDHQRRLTAALADLELAENGSPGS